MTDNRFYYDGIFYDNEEQFYNAVTRFSNSEISSESAKRILDKMCEDILLNLFMHTEKQITNDQLKQISSYIMIRFINQYRKALERKNG